MQSNGDGVIRKLNEDSVSRFRAERFGSGGVLFWWGMCSINCGVCVAVDVWRKVANLRRFYLVKSGTDS